MVVDKQDVDAGLDVTVLESIVEQDDVDILVVFCQFLYAMYAFLVNGDDGLGKLGLHLVRLVANIAGRGVLIGKQVTSCLSFIASAEHSHTHVILKQANQILNVRRFTRAAHCEIAHRDDGYAECVALQHSDIEEEVAKTHYRSVYPAEGQQPFVGFDEVAFHACYYLILAL